MNLIARTANTFEFFIETLDDLWVLSQFIIQDDKLYATTERKVKIGTDINYKVVKKLIFVELLVKQVKFESDTLRAAGEIQNETEFTAKGASHTLTFKIGDKIKIEKKELLKFEKKLIDNACNTKKSTNLLILLDKDELLACEFTQVSFKVLFKKTGLGSKKYNNMQINDEEEKFKLIEDIITKEYSQIILAGPGLFKDKLQKYIKDKIGLTTLTFSWSDVSSVSVQKVINKIYESSSLRDSQIAQETKYITKLLENINKNQKFVYGQKNTYDSVQNGSCDALLISTKYIETSKDNNEYLELNEIIKLAEQLNGELIIIDSKNEPGKIIDGLGGIAGILRY